MTAPIEDSISGWEDVEGRRVRGVGSGECGRWHNVTAQSVGQKNPPVTDASRDTARLIGHTDQPAGRHGRDARRVCRLALSTGMLIASLDPAPRHCRRRNLLD
jgi:hypothetical protein